MKTNELTGAALDWAVCEATGFFRGYTQFRTGKNFLKVWGAARNTHLHPSTDWSQGGPIIEREHISIEATRVGGLGDRWMAEDTGHCTEFADVPLIAAMRCYVASKLGKDVEIPKELQ
jgi:hypothetical protein